MPPKNANNSAGSWWPGGRNQPPEVPGLNELVELLNLMGSAPPGSRPQLNPDLIEAIRGSPLQPVIKALQPIYKKLCSMAETEQARPATPKPEAQQPPPPPPPQATATPPPAPADVAPQQQSNVTPAVDVSGIEAGMLSLSSKLDFVSQAVTDIAKQKDMAGSFQTLEDNLRQADSETRNAVKAAANASNTQFETVDTKVSQMSGKLDPTLTELTQGIKKLQVGLLGDVKTERARLETKVNDLEKEVKELQQVIDATKAELLPVEVASKIALQGTFSDELDKTSSRAGSGNNAGNVLQTAKRVRTNTLGLITKCRALFTFINRDPETSSNSSDLGTEGEWGRCAEHLRASNSRLRGAIEEKEESAQKMQFVGFVVDQIRKGNYTEKEWKKDANGKKFAALIEKSPDGFASIQLLAQDLSRITATVMTVPVVPPPSVIPAVPTPSIIPTVPATPVTPTTVTPATNTPAVNAATADTKTRAGKTSAGIKGASARGNPPTTEPTSVTATSSTTAVPKGPTPLTATATSKPSAAPTSTPLPTPPATAAITAPANTKAPPAKGNPTTAQPTATSNGPMSFTAPAGSKMSAARTTAAIPKTPMTPVAPVPPRSPSPVTAPSSPVATTVPVPEKQDPDVRPAPAKKSSSYFRTKSVLNRTPGPLSGWGPLVG